MYFLYFNHWNFYYRWWSPVPSMCHSRDWRETGGVDNRDFMVPSSLRGSHLQNTLPRLLNRGNLGGTLCPVTCCQTWAIIATSCEDEGEHRSVSRLQKAAGLSHTPGNCNTLLHFIWLQKLLLFIWPVNQIFIDSLSYASAVLGFCRDWKQVRRALCSSGAYNWSSGGTEMKKLCANPTMAWSSVLHGELLIIREQLHSCTGQRNTDPPHGPGRDVCVEN